VLAQMPSTPTGKQPTLALLEREYRPKGGSYTKICICNCINKMLILSDAISNWYEKMRNKLFVIGNGFDLHHQIPSKYSQFGDYLKTASPKIFNYVEKYLFHEQVCENDLWSTFEERLAHLDDDQIIEEAEQFLVSYGAEDWSDAYHHDFEYEIEQVVGGLSTKLRDHFANWVRTLPIPASFQGPPLKCIDTQSKFLNFNYTPTLQKLYNIPNDNVLHIHGCASDPNASIILGHGCERSSQEMLLRQVDEDTDTRVAGGYQLIDDYFTKTFKQSALIIQQEQAFFEGLKDVTDVWVLGHSLSEVDYPYFEQIIKNTSASTQWIVSYRSNASQARNTFANYGVAEGRYRFKRLIDL
jgi:hypothetical protein